MKKYYINKTIDIQDRNKKNGVDINKKVIEKSPTSIHICLISPLPPPFGGISNWTLLIHRIANESGNVRISQIDTAPRWRAIEDLSKFKRIMGGSVQFLRDYFRLFIAIKKKPDVIHQTTSGELSTIQNLIFCLTSRLFRIPFIYHLRFGRIPEIANKKTLEWQLLACVIRNSNAIIAVTPKTAEVIKAFIPNSNIWYIPNPIDLSPIPENLAAKKSGNTVFYLGWILPTKGIEELVEAWSEVEQKKWKLLLAGPGNIEYQHLLIKKYKPANIKFMGELIHNEALKSMANCDIFVLPSYTEGFPNVILEAMALGKPIIATSVGAIPEMLSTNCGLLVEPKNVEELKSSILSLIENEELRLRLGKNAIEKVQSQYTTDIVFNQYATLWSKCIKDKSKNRNL